MTKPKVDPTLNDIYLKLGKQDVQLEQIHAQVKKTNGRVTTLEDKTSVLEGKQRDADVISDYLLKHPAQTQTETEVKEGWSTREKQLIAFITALLAIIATLVGTGKI